MFFNDSFKQLADLAEHLKPGDDNEEHDTDDEEYLEHLLLIWFLTRSLPKIGNRARGESVFVNNSSIKAINFEPTDIHVYSSFFARKVHMGLSKVI